MRRLYHVRLIKSRLINYNLYKIKHILSENDILGLIIKTKCDIEKFLKEEYGIESKGIRQKGAFLYKQYTTAGEEIVEKIILSSTIFLVKGRNVKMITENLEKHVNTRKNVINVAKKYNIDFPDNNEDNVDNLVSRLKNGHCVKKVA